MINISKSTVATPHGEISIYTLVNAGGCTVRLSSLGAGIVEVSVPGRDGTIDNVALAYASAADYMADGPCLGKVPGRYANRIAGGHLLIDGREYQLAINNGPNALHGGPAGFQNRIWESGQIEGGVRFTYRSADGEENYPGNLVATATYRWSDDNVLSVTFEAVSDATTVVNLTNHAYWNLDGADSGTALDHTMRIAADRYIPTDDSLIPLGTLEAVAGTPMDFRSFRRVGERIGEDFPALRYGKGYDAGWMVNGWKPGVVAEDVVTLRSARSGRILSIDSDQPDVHIYTGNWLSGSPLNRSGKSYGDYDGIAIELQGVPDAPNQRQFPSQELRPGERYSRTIRFKFTVGD